MTCGKRNNADMFVVDAEWIKKRLGDDRGRKAELARAMGIEADKLSKILGGTRNIKAEEVPKILKFFGAIQEPLDPQVQRLVSILVQLKPEELAFLGTASEALLAARGQVHSQPAEEEK